MHNQAGSAGELSRREYTVKEQMRKLKIKKQRIRASLYRLKCTYPKQTRENFFDNFIVKIYSHVLVEYMF